MATSQDRYWVILNDAELKLSQQHHVLQVLKVRDSSHGINWKLHQNLENSIYHMIYLTVLTAFVMVQHQRISPPPTRSSQVSYWTVTFIIGKLKSCQPPRSLNWRQHCQGHLPLASFMDEMVILRCQTPLIGVSGGASVFMQSQVPLYESVSISDKYVSKSVIFIVNHVSARLNKKSRFHVSFLSTPSQHLLLIIRIRHGIQEKTQRIHGQTVILCGNNDHITTPRWLGFNGIKFSAIRNVRIKPQCQVCRLW